MTKNTGARKARRNNPTFDLLVYLDSHTVSSEEISFVFAHWGKVRDVHRPYEDRDYRIVRYERKDEMKAALRGYHDGSMKYLQPEWLKCSVYESPSNSLFEVIVRDVPANISDKEWYDCITKYGTVRTVYRIPGPHGGVCDMFVAMEDQRSHNVLKALLVSLGKYHATLSDIFYGNFIPPASFCSAIENPIIVPSIPKRRGHRDYYYSSPSANHVMAAMAVNPAQVALCRHNSRDRVAAMSLRRFHGYTPSAPDPSKFRQVVLLTRKKSLSPPVVGSSSGVAETISSSAAELQLATRKDPSDIWFSCGEETEESALPVKVPLLPTLKPDPALLTDPRSLTVAEVISPVLPVLPVIPEIPVIPEVEDIPVVHEIPMNHEDSGLSSDDDEVAGLPGEPSSVPPLEDENDADDDASFHRNSPPSLSDRDETLLRGILSGVVSEGYRKRRRPVLPDIPDISQTSPPSMKASPSMRLPFPSVGVKTNREMWKARSKLPRHGSDPISLKQYAALHQSSSLLELPGCLSKLNTRSKLLSTMDSASSFARGMRPLKSTGDSQLGRKNGVVSLMGVPFPSDRSPLRIHYNIAKQEGRVVTLRFSETKIENYPLAMSGSDDAVLSAEEQKCEDSLIAKWQRAYAIFQMRKSDERRKSRSPIISSVIPRGLSLSECTLNPPSRPLHRVVRKLSSMYIMDKSYDNAINTRSNGSSRISHPEDARNRFFGHLGHSKNSADYSFNLLANS